MRALEWVRAVNRDSILARSPRLVAYALASHSTGGDTSLSRASWRTLGDWTGLSRAAVHRALRSLHEQGWIAILHEYRHDGGQAPNTYLFTVPVPVDNPPDEYPPRLTRETPPVSSVRPPSAPPPVSLVRPLEGKNKGSSKVPAVTARPVEDVIAAITRARRLR